MSTQTTFLTGLASRIQDAEAKLTQADLIDCLTAALNEYSAARPRYVTAEVTSDGSAFLALPATWDLLFSKVARIDELDANNAPEYVMPAVYQIITNPAPEAEVFFFTDETPAAGTKYRIKYAVRHTITTSASTVPSADETIVMDLAASIAFLRLAAAYAQSTDPQIGTVTLDYKSKTDLYKGLARDFRQRFVDALNSGALKPAAAQRAWQRPQLLFHK